MTFEVQVADAGEEGIRTLSVRGEVDMDSSSRLRDAIKREIKGASALRLDLSGVPYMDSSGVAVLIQGYKQAQKAGCDFALVDPSAQVTAVISMAQLDQLFRVERTES